MPILQDDGNLATQLVPRIKHLTRATSGHTTARTTEEEPGQNQELNKMVEPKETNQGTLPAEVGTDQVTRQGRTIKFQRLCKTLITTYTYIVALMIEIDFKVWSC